jgi:HAD superfamily hydrolase (TIGR01509 family)
VIFERALAIAQAKPECVLFVDDREQNLAPAKAMGMQALHFKSPDSLRESLHGLNLL